MLEGITFLSSKFDVEIEKKIMIKKVFLINLVLQSSNFTHVIWISSKDNKFK